MVNVATAQRVKTADLSTTNRLCTFYIPGMSSDTLIASDESKKHFPNLGLAQKLYVYEQRVREGGDGKTERQAALEAIFADDMAPFYGKCCEKYGWELDAAKLEAMTAVNTKSLEEIETKTQEAITNAGDTEVLDLMFAKAQHFCQIGAWAEAFTSYDAILAKEKTGTGKKIDATMAKTRLALFDLVRRWLLLAIVLMLLFSL